MDAGSKQSKEDQAQRNVQNAVTSLEAKQAQDEYKKKLKEKADQQSSSLWQHPFVDVFKHFKLLPGSDWKQNKKAGDVTEYFAKEIGRRAIEIQGTISANNFIQMPSAQGSIKSLGLTGRYLYLEVKSPKHGLPFSYHFDLGMAERSHGIRISVSNLFKNFNTSNGFVAQVPLELKNNCWTVVVFDIYELLKRSEILPPSYLIDGSYQIRSINICANTHVRGVFTSDNLYDFVTLPADMRFKFAFDLSKWPEYFDWQTLPHDWSKRKGPEGEFPGDENMNLQNLISQQKERPAATREEQRMQMRQEIDELIDGRNRKNEESEIQDDAEEQKQKRYDEMQRQLQMQFQKGPADHPVSGFIIKDDEDDALAGPKRKTTGGSTDYRGGQYSGYDLSRSHKLNKDPIMELKHIIGYQADKCMNLKWSRQEGENVVLFTSGGTIIAMDSENNEQRRFFFGHSAPVCCFDLNEQGTMLASAQEGQNSIIRIWDYATARCLTMMTMPVISLKCLSFSHDGRYLASVGKDKHNKELICVWDISRITRGEMPEICARQTSEFNILSLKFSPIDSSRLASCGKENIRFWRVRETGNIRGSAVVLQHHARNTVFTCLDFEYGFRSADRSENESLKRIFVGSKHGMVFQVNYQNETLEASYKTNDGAIFSIAVNDAFCVLGSEDTYLRVWPLDFQEFFMEAQHEGTVSAVDISPDGLKVVCGTLYGSIGILDKSNQNYKTLLRSHTDEILAMDFHVHKQNIITVSKDKTIRLWDIQSNDEVYEFSSPVDQPLCVAAHPQQSIFACGFESGKMRIFDIDTTEVLDEFSQFNKPLKSLRYDNSGKLLIACCQDGQVSIHNAARQHLPIKMMHLELPPEFVHVAFSERIAGETDDAYQKFAVMGEYGNNVIIYDTDSFLIQHQIMVHHIIKSFKFANNNRDLLVVTKDCKIRFYSLMKYEGIFLREVANCHRGAINGLAVSGNSGYMLSGGEDNMVKIWDYEAQKSVPYYFQSFIGHTYPINALTFNPRNNAQIFSVGEKDGIFIWDFNGDIDSDYKQGHLSGQDMPTMSATEEKPQSLLEQIRTTNKAKKAFRNQMSDDSFIIPQFKPIEQCGVEITNDEFFESPNIVKHTREDRKLTYNHYTDCSQKADKHQQQDMDSQHFMKEYQLNTKSHPDESNKMLEQKLISGYDGFGGVHDNLLWNVTAGFTYYTLNNKLIIENTKTREQTVLADSTVQLSCIAGSADGKYIAVGEGSPNAQGNAIAYLYDVETVPPKRLPSRLAFHQKGIQSMAFSYDSKYLITLGVQGDDTLAVTKISQTTISSASQTGTVAGTVVARASIQNQATNQVKVDPRQHDDPSDQSQIQFITVGNDAALTTWRLDVKEDVLSKVDAASPDNLKNVHFLSIEFTQYLPAPANTYYAVIGASDGSIVAYDMEKREYVDAGTRGAVVEGQVGAISIKKEASDRIVVASSAGCLCQFSIYDTVIGAQIQPPVYGDPDVITTFNCDSAIVALSMDDHNNEGLVGTENGTIYYVNFSDVDQSLYPIPIVSSNNINRDSISLLKVDPGNPQIFVSNCGQKSAQFKINTIVNCDLVYNNQNNLEDDGYVVFIISTKEKKETKKAWRLVGFSNGIIKRFNFGNLSPADRVFKLPLNPGEVLTCGFYSENETNFVVGTNHGTIFFCSMRSQGRSSSTAHVAEYCRIENVSRSSSFADVKVKSQKNLNPDIFNDNGSELTINRDDSQDDLNLFVGVTSIHFPSTEPIGVMLVAFDDGSIRLWKSVEKNKQLMKIYKLEQEQHASKRNEPRSANAPVKYDISQVGYQQFDMVDNFDIFQNPHNERQDTEEERAQTKAIYNYKKHPSCEAKFAPENITKKISMPDQYFCFVEALPYIFIRNFERHTIIHRINLSKPTQYPTSMKLFDASKLKVDEESGLKGVLPRGSGNFLVAVGTKEGRVFIYRYSAGSANDTKLFWTKEGTVYGAITSLDISPRGDDVLAGSAKGEIHHWGLLDKINKYESGNI